MEDLKIKVPTGGNSKSYALIDEALNFKGTAEKTLWDSSDNPETQFHPFNPDDIYQKDGDYSTYEEMMNDDQVDVSMQLKKDLVLGSGFEFVPGDEGQEEIIQNLEYSFIDRPPVPFEDKLEELLTAYEFGFSVSEKIFAKAEDGSLCYGDLRTRHPNTWLFYQDKYGNIEKYMQRGGATQGDIEIKNHASLIHYVNRPRFQNVYGRSDLRACYAAWVIKKQIIKFKAIYMEKAASATPVGKYGPNTPDESVEALFNSLKKLQTKTAMVIPDSIGIEFLEAKNNGEIYTKAINLFNMFISRSLFIPDLVGFGGSETSGGSFSLGKEQMGLFFKHIQRRRKTLETLINRHLVKPIIMFNFGDVENPPKFRFKPISDEDALALADVWLKAVNGKAFIPNDDEVNHFRKLVKFPEGEVEQPQPAPPPGNNPNNPSMDGEEGENEGLPEESDEQEADAEAGSDIDEQLEEDMEKMGKFKSNYAKCYKLPPGNYHKRTDFKAIEAQLNAATSTTMDKVKPLIEEIAADMAKQIERKSIIKNQDVSKIDALSVKKLGQLKKILKGDLREGFKSGQASGQKELIKGNFALPVPTDQFLTNLEAETFQYIGEWEYKIRQKTAVLLRQAIKDGTPLSVVLNQVKEEIVSYGEESVERYSRTKTTEVFNRGRQQFFEESGIVQGYQYSAILDSRTSDICLGLDGKFFKEGDQPIPPMHFNCRSLLIPITKYEDFKPTDEIDGMSPDEFIEENKGDGFSKQ